jgi:hypothetical protein
MNGNAQQTVSRALFTASNLRDIIVILSGMGLYSAISTRELT